MRRFTTRDDDDDDDDDDDRADTDTPRCSCVRPRPDRTDTIAVAPACRSRLDNTESKRATARYRRCAALERLANGRADERGLRA
jgi:hypothetical protein